MVVEVKGASYHMGEGLKRKWDSLKGGKIKKVDEDRFYIIDGHEGAGKSLFTIQQAAYIDPTILNDEDNRALPRICFSVEEFLNAVRKTRSTNSQTKCVIFDEAFRGMSSKAALSKINKQIVESLMEIRQNNLIVFIVSPSFYLLEFYTAVLRSKALFHVVKEKNSTGRYVRIFNYRKKAMLYQVGVRKGWGYPLKTKAKVRFFNKYPGGDEFEQRYRKKKRKSLTDGPKKVETVHKWKEERNIVVKTLYKELGTYEKVVEKLKKTGLKISLSQVGKICQEENTKIMKE